MGFQVGTGCYETQAEAENVYFADVPPVIINANSYRIFEPATTGTGWMLKTLSVASNGNITVSSQYKATTIFPSCDNKAIFADGAELGFLVMSPALAIWAILFLRKAF